ncbi:MAG: hypothetical protein AB7T31_01820 [Gemmatimonadales bacterium]
MQALLDLSLARRSFAAAPAVWIGVTLACVALTVIATWVGVRIGGFTGYLFGEFRLEGLYAGLMTAVTAFFLGAAGMSLFAVAWLFGASAATRALAIPWGIAATGLFVLGADDLLFAHEILAFRLEAHGVPRIIGENVALAVYIAGTLLVLPRLLETVRRYWRSAFPLLFGLAMFATSVLVEVITPSGSSAVAVIGGIVDRAGKVIGTVMMFAFAQILVVEVASDPERGTDLRRS